MNGTYTFTISHTGENTMVVNGDGSITYTYEEYSTPLPRYDENGSLYTYVLREMSVDWVDNVEEAGKTVLESVQGEGTYVVENTYTSPKGSISVKKHLELPADLGVDDKFPSIQFKLTRTYTGYVDGEVEEDKPDEAFNSDPNNTITWDWTAIKEKYENIESSSGGDTVWVSSPDEGEGVLVFNNLDLYAPNGSRYVYTVEEVTEDFLYGYTTYAGAGNLEQSGVTNPGSLVGGLSPDPAEPAPGNGDTPAVQTGGETGSETDTSWATFKNERAQKTVTLTGTKIWEDFNNVFQLRPGWDDDTDSPIGFSLTLSRYANAQENEDNAIPEEELTEGENYAITWSTDETNTWSYTISGTGGNALEAYAPNGMPWIYKVTESMDPDLLAQQIYRADPGVSITGSAPQQSSEKSVSIPMPSITNTMSSNTTFTKQWRVLDENGNPQSVTGDYLGQDLSVSVKVQVREKADATTPGSGVWQDAKGYFHDTLSDNAYTQIFPDNNETSYFERTITGRLNGNWSETFDNLPAAIRKNNASGQTTDTSITYLEYRVVETSVSYDGISQAITITDDGTDYNDITQNSGDIVIDADLTSNLQTTNTLDLQSITIQKIWEDNNNQWNTRPNPTGDYTWETSFVVQKKNGSDWENVQVHTGETSQDLVVTLRGINEAPADGWTETITGLPAGEYRIRELQPGWNEDDQITDEDMVEDGGFYYGNAYEAIYNKVEIISL